MAGVGVAGGCVSPSTHVQPSFGVPSQSVSSPGAHESASPGPTATMTMTYLQTNNSSSSHDNIHSGVPT